MSAAQTVAGIYLERTGATVLLADAHRADDGLWQLDILDKARIPWHPFERQMVKDGLDQLRSTIHDMRHDVQSVGIASYGPFESLTPSSLSGTDRTKYVYGRIREDTAHEPLRGLKLFELLSAELGTEWISNAEHRIVIHTDVSACALGEAYARRIAEHETLAFLCVTEGIGLALVRGGEVITSALHPEVGLLPAYLQRRDPLANQPEYDLPISSVGGIDFYSTSSIEQLASDGALARRLKKMMPMNQNPTYADIMAIKDQNFWDIRAAYLAQACIACTVITPPDFIVIGAQTDPLENVDKRTWFLFKAILELWRKRKQPVFDYEALDGLNNSSFISKPCSTSMANTPTDLAILGATGMCYAASCMTTPSKKS